MSLGQMTTIALCVSMYFEAKGQRRMVGKSDLSPKAIICKGLSYMVIWWIGPCDLPEIIVNSIYEPLTTE